MTEDKNRRHAAAASDYGTPASHNVPVLRAEGYLNMHYLEWGAEHGGIPVVCVHGLTRNARDFDAVASGMAAAGRRVICVDILGRGGSDWLSDPAGYTNPLSAQDMATLFARLDVEHVDWLGTSMGGIIGMLVAAMPGNPIRRMVINDIGAFVPKSAIARIRDYLRIDYSFQTLAHLRNHLKKVHSPFGPLNEAQWDHMAHFSHRVCPDEGKVIHHYDPALKHTMIDPPLSEIDIWALWDCLRCETLVLRGEHSDLLLSETANNMHGRGPGSGEGKGYGWVEFADAGHAPALVEPEQIEMVTGFFQGGLDALPSEALK